VLDSFGLFYGDFCMDLYAVDSNEAMKRGDEALNASSLQFLRSVNASLLHRYDLLLSVKRFIAVNFYGKTSFNASLPLLLKRNLPLNASSPLLFKVTLPTSAYLSSRYVVAAGTMWSILPTDLTSPILTKGTCLCGNSRFF
jgi:hypothetical protein